MSVAIAVAMDTYGLVVSDSRRVESGGRSLCDDIDKTFVIDQPKIIGANVGLLEFNGRTIGQHAQEIAKEEADKSTTLEALCLNWGACLAERLANISEDEVGFPCREMDLLIIGRSRLTKGKPRVCSIELTADMQNHTITSNTKLWPESDYYVTVGDDQARGYIHGKMPSPEKRFILNRLVDAKVYIFHVTSEAIKHCGNHPLYEGIRSCGGVPRLRELPVDPSLREQVQ